MIGNAVLSGLFKPILSSGVPIGNAPPGAADRGIEVIESRSSRPRDYTSLISVKLQADEGDRLVEGAVFQRSAPRLVLVDGVAVESPLEGTMIVLCNTDQPGVIGDVGTILGRHGVNIATFALGRDGDRAVGLVIVDEPPDKPVPEVVLEELRRLKTIREARLVRV
jgi:D-3-phosphoglycerate dehydrogenase